MIGRLDGREVGFVCHPYRRSAAGSGGRWSQSDDREPRARGNDPYPALRFEPSALGAAFTSRSAMNGSRQFKRCTRTVCFGESAEVAQVTSRSPFRPDAFRCPVASVFSVGTTLARASDNELQWQEGREGGRSDQSQDTFGVQRSQWIALIRMILLKNNWRARLDSNQ
jgi:hypothetical protein